MNDEIRVTRTAEDNGFDRDGKAKHEIVVTFMDGDYGPFTMTFPKDGFNGVTARSALDAYVQQLRALRR